MKSFLPYQVAAPWPVLFPSGLGFTIRDLITARQLTQSMWILSQLSAKLKCQRPKYVPRYLTCYLLRSWRHLCTGCPPAVSKGFSFLRHPLPCSRGWTNMGNIYCLRMFSNESPRGASP